MEKNLAKSALIAIAIITCFTSCLVMENEFPALPPGMWRAELNLDAKIPSSNNLRYILPDEDNSLPFVFELKYDENKNMSIDLINGEERITVDDVTFGHNRATGRDSVIINFEVFGTHIIAYFEEDVLEGRWFVPAKGDYSIPFFAKHGTPNRFDFVAKESDFDVTGLWEVQFGVEDEPYPAIGEFDQQNRKVNGTFRTETGDYRYLEGVVDDQTMWMSVFDGSHAFLFKGKQQPDKTINGFFKSGKHYQTLWNGKKNPDAQLIDPDSLTYLKEDAGAFEFSFPDEDGKIISLSDSAFAGKGKIVQILGTWCPNCRDETKFLVDFLKKSKADISVIGLAFERFNDDAKDRLAIKTYREKMGVNYPILHAGSAKKSEAAKQLPMLNAIISYPTLIFLDKDNNIKRIHTGFNGPATSIYKDFTKSFEQTVSEIQ